MYGAIFPVAKMRKRISEPTCYLRSLESRNKDNKKQNFIDWKDKRNSKNQNLKPILIISKEELQRARETRASSALWKTAVFLMPPLFSKILIFDLSII